MFGTLKGRSLIIIGLLVLAGMQLVMNKRTHDRWLNLGLDLQGGMHLVLEVADPDGTMTSEARRDATDRALKIIRTRIDEFGVEEPVVQRVGDQRIIVELPGVTDEERAKQIIQRAAYLEWALVLPARQLTDALPRIDRAIVQAVGPEGLPDRVRREEPGDAVRDLLFQRQRPDTAAADTAAAEQAEPQEPQEPQQAARDARPLTGLLLESGAEDGEFFVLEEDVELVQAYLDLDEVRRLIPRNISLHWATRPQGIGAELYRSLYVLSADPVITGERLVNAVAGRDQQFNQTIVSFQLDRRGGRVFEQTTRQNLGNRIAIVLDGQVHSAPVLRGVIAQRGQIELGQAPMAEAQDLALVLRAGALPAPLEIMEERTVGPTLGADAIEQGKVAGVVGVLLVLVVMLVYYRVAGLLALFALGCYVLFVLGGLAGFNATLTLPGIAGLILSIGMAVDANVLIFERIREELAAGRTVRTAVDEGFQNAMSAIVDANLTTLMTALILFNVGTGPVRGFAVTLSIGIVASFFTAVFITRTLFMVYLDRKRATSPMSI